MQDTRKRKQDVGEREVKNVEIPSCMLRITRIVTVATWNSAQRWKIRRLEYSVAFLKNQFRDDIFNPGETKK